MNVVVAGRVSPVVLSLDEVDCEAAAPEGADDVCPLLVLWADATVTPASATTIATTTRFRIRSASR
jgi:hypothetical protein